MSEYLYILILIYLLYNIKLCNVYKIIFITTTNKKIKSHII